MRGRLDTPVGLKQIAHILPEWGIKQRSTHLLHDRQNPRLAVVIAVRADSEVDLVGVGIGLEGSREFENPATSRRSALRGRVKGASAGTRTHRGAQAGPPSNVLRG